MVFNGYQWLMVMMMMMIMMMMILFLFHYKGIVFNTAMLNHQTYEARFLKCQPSRSHDITNKMLPLLYHHCFGWLNPHSFVISSWFWINFRVFKLLMIVPNSNANICSNPQKKTGRYLLGVQFSPDLRQYFKRFYCTPRCLLTQESDTDP